MKKTSRDRQQKKNHKQRKNNEMVKQKQKERQDSFASRMKTKEYERKARSNREYHTHQREMFRTERQRGIGLMETVIISTLGSLDHLMTDIKSNRNFTVTDESHRLNDKNTIDLSGNDYKVVDKT